MSIFTKDILINHWIIYWKKIEKNEKIEKIKKIEKIIVADLMIKQNMNIFVIKLNVYWKNE